MKEEKMEKKEKAGMSPPVDLKELVSDFCVLFDYIETSFNSIGQRLVALHGDRHCF